MELASQETPSSPTGSSPSIDIRSHHCSSSLVPFHWEETPGTPKYLYGLETEKPYSKDGGKDEQLQFDFKLGRRSAFTTTNELFEKGRIKPLKLPPRLEVVHIGCGAGTVSARWAKSTSPLFYSLRQRDKVEEFDPFERAIEEIISCSRTKDDHVVEANLATADSSNNKKKRHWKDFLTFKATLSNHHTYRDHLGKDVRSRTPSSVSLLSSKVVVEEQKFSSFRLTYEHALSHKLASITAKELVWGSFKMVAPEELVPRPIAPNRRPLFRGLDPRSTIQNVLRKVLGS